MLFAGLSEISARFDTKQYRTAVQVISDVGLIVDNCRFYNGELSEYTKLANEMEAFFVRNLEELRIRWKL